MKRHSLAYRSMLLVTVLSLLLMPLRAFSMVYGNVSEPAQNLAQGGCHDMQKSTPDTSQKSDSCCCDDMSNGSCHCMSPVALTSDFPVITHPVLNTPPVSIMLKPESTPPPALLKPPQVS